MSVVTDIKKVATDVAGAVGLEQLVKLVEQVPAEAIIHLATVIKGALGSKDPVRYLKRIAVAQAAHSATKAAVKTTLKNTK